MNSHMLQFLYVDCLCSAEALPWSDPILFSFASLYWISTVAMLTISVVHGYCRLIVPKFNPKTIWELFDVFQVS